MVKRFSGLHKEQSFISLISFKNEPNEICRNLIEKGSKDGFFAPDKIKNHTCEKKEKRNRNSEEGEKRRREKSNGSLHPYFYNVYFRSFWPKKLLEGRLSSIWR